MMSRCGLPGMRRRAPGSRPAFPGVSSPRSEVSRRVRPSYLASLIPEPSRPRDNRPDRVGSPVRLMAAPDLHQVILAVQVALAVILRLLAAASRLGDLAGRRPGTRRFGGAG